MGVWSGATMGWTTSLFDVLHLIGETSTSVVYKYESASNLYVVILSHSLLLLRACIVSIGFATAAASQGAGETLQSSVTSQ